MRARASIGVVMACLLMGCSGADDHPPASGGASTGPGNEPRLVRLSPGQLSHAHVQLSTAGPGLIREILPLYGSIGPNGERVREVAARYPGVIREVRRATGDAVREGEALAVIESNESLQTYVLRAPLSGVVTQRNANPGEQSGEKVLFTVADLSTVWVELSLFPRDVARVRVGQMAQVRSTDGGLSAQGQVIYVAPFGRAASQTVTARVRLDNAARHWAPGLYVTADVTVSESPVPLAVLTTAVQQIQDTPTVFVEAPGGFVARPVQLGRHDGTMTEVRGGLSPGQRYVSLNSYVLKAELLKTEGGH